MRQEAIDVSAHRLIDEAIPAVMFPISDGLESNGKNSRGVVFLGILSVYTSGDVS
jgi:hypothetical protein